MKPGAHARAAAVQPQIITSSGASLHAELCGVAVGFSETGVLTTISAGLEALSLKQLRELSQALAVLTIELERGQRGPTH